MTLTRRALGWIIVLGAALACGEATTPSAPAAPAPVSALNARIGCVANTHASEVRCVYVDSAVEAGLHAGSMLRDLIVGGQNTYVTLASSNISYAGDVFSFNTTVQNLLGQPLGTSDGTTLDANGVRVFFTEAPVVTTGTGTIDFVNPVGGASMVDGTATFTTSNQAYYQYNQIIGAGQTSSAKTWRIHVPATVGEFEFAVYVSAAVPHIAGYIDVTPLASSLQIGATEQLTATLRDVVGRADVNETVTWSTSNAAVATVGAGTGVATAVGGGTATITATTATRTGSATITVGGTVTHFAITGVGGGAIGQHVAGAPFNVQVTALDVNGNTASFNGSAVLTSTGTLSGAPVATASFVNGVLTAQAVTITSAGSFTLTVTCATPSATGTSPSFTVVAGAPTSITKNAGDAQSGTAGAAVNTAPSVLIRDAHGNPVSGVTVTFTPTSGGSVTGATPTTNSSGIATVGSWTLGNTVGSNVLSASVVGLSAATFNATGVAGAVAHVTVHSGNNQTAQVGTAVATAPQVLVTDAHSNPVPNATVTFSVTIGSGAATGTTASSDASGLAAVTTWTLGTASGTNALVATANSINATFTAVATPGPVASFLVVNPAGSAISIQVANNAFQIKLVAQDAFLNIATGFNGTAVLTSSGTLSGAPLTTAAFTSGVLASQSVTLSSTGSTTITATNSPSVPATGTSAAFTVLAQVGISSSTPANNAVNVAPSSNIVLTFSRAVTVSTSSFTVQCPASTSNVAYTISGSGTTTVTLTPTSDLPAATTCQVTAIAAQITDLIGSGTHPAADQTIAFTTR